MPIVMCGPYHKNLFLVQVLDFKLEFGSRGCRVMGRTSRKGDLGRSAVNTALGDPSPQMLSRLSLSMNCSNFGPQNTYFAAWELRTSSALE